MKIVKFKGGLGNQLFQYVLLRKLQLTYKCEIVKGDFSYYKDFKNDSIRKPRIMELNIKIEDAADDDLSKICLFGNHGNPSGLSYKIKIMMEQLFNQKYYFEHDRRFRNLNKLLKYEYFDGYWQSWRYLEGIENEIISEIRIKNLYSIETQEIIDKIKNENAVFIGIRRGDYIESQKAKKHYDIFDKDYYIKAINYIKEHVKNPIFYIFSNDIDWVKTSMSFDGEVVYRNKEDQTSDVEELFIMAACKHAIIANSTYYWWGAWLIENQKKIIVAPKQWFADSVKIDIVPDTWIKM